MTTDGVLVTPATKASADMYAYNPEVGRLWGGGRLVGGNSDFCQWWERFGFGRPEPLVLNPQNPTLTCPDGSVTFTASGGRLPYTWSTTKGEITPGVDTKTATLKPPPTTVGGVAYQTFVAFRSDCAPQGGSNYKRAEFDCSDTQLTCGVVNWFFPCIEGPCNIAGNPNNTFCLTCEGPKPDIASYSCPGGGSPQYMGCSLEPGTCSVPSQTFCDKRTQPVIDAGCKPCSLEMQDGATVTVTDSTGASTKTTVTAR